MVLDQYIRPEEIAKKLAIDIQTVHRWLKSKKLKGVKAGKQWRVKESDLQAFLDRPPDDPVPQRKKVGKKKRK